MRDQLQDLTTSYPKRPTWRDPSFKGSPLHALVRDELPAAFRAAVPLLQSRYLLKGSIGNGDWTHTPWLVILDPAVTTRVEEGYYIVYLLSLGGEHLYITLNQGCTLLKDSVGLPGARAALAQRASTMWSRIEHRAQRLGNITIDLNVGPSVWRGKLYEMGSVAAKRYDAQSLPSEDEMVADLHEALDLYARLAGEGGWDAEDSIMQDAKDDGIAGDGLVQAKRYRQHRAIERQASHSKKVKAAQGCRCRACELEMSEVYGDLATGMIDAHHLTPLAGLADGQVVTFDPIIDFAVLCPNCHRAIHRLDDPSDLGALRGLIRTRQT